MRLTFASFYLVGTVTLALAQPAGEGQPVEPVFLPPSDEPPPPTLDPTVKLKPTNGKTEFTLDGYLQPQFRVRENSSVDDDTNGFRFARVRPMLRSSTTYGALELTSTFEFEVQPSFSMLDAFFGVKRSLGCGGSLTVDVGQMRVPVSRQQMLSDSRLQFIDKAQIASIAPRRDLGIRVTFVVPGHDRLKLFVGMHNGEGLNQVENLNEKFLYTGRIAYTLLGKESKNEESSFNDDYLTLAVSGGHNRTDADDRNESIYLYGADIAGAYKGISGSVEWLELAHEISDADPTLLLPSEFKQRAWSGQLAYMLPMKLWRESRLEVGARIEEVDRNDEAPLMNPGDPEQAQRIYTAATTYYLRKHALKATLAFNHITEVDDKTVTQANASYDNDQVVLQLTYRME